MSDLPPEALSATHTTAEPTHKQAGRWVRAAFWVLPMLAAALVGAALYLLVVLQSMSNSTLEATHDSGQWVAFQLERENNRFFYTLNRHVKGEAALPGQQPPSWADVQTRFDILYSRLVSLQGSSMSLLSERTVVEKNAQQISALIEEMDGILQQGQDVTLKRLGEVQHASEELRTLAETMLLDIVEYRGERITEIRHRQLKIYQQITWLVLMLTCAAAAFVALLLRQMRAVHRAYQQVDSLAVQLRQSAQKAEDASRSKSQFLANMSHEIRTPMNAILGMLQLLQGTGLKERQSDYVSKAGEAARSLLGILNDILDFSKVEAGKMTLDPQSFSLNQLLRELATIMSHNLGKKRLELLFDIDPAVPDALVCDTLRLKQVLINLAGNAIKFTQQGEVRLGVQLVSSNNLAACLRFSVADTGIGISPEQRSRIFEGFSQAEASISRRFGGTGLGLAISRRMIELMGGELQLESEPGRGSRFEFTLELPLADKSHALVQQEHPSLAAMHALVVAQAPGTRELLARMATELGWVVQTAADGETALNLLAQWTEQHEPCDVVLVDWLLPGLDGWTTAQRMRSAGHPLVVMVTSNPQDMLEGRSPQDVAQAGSFLVKPFTRSMVFEAVMSKRNELRGIQLPAPAQATHAHLPLYGLRLLVVEDNPINQQVAQELLRSAGARVTLAENGREGVQAVREALEPFDLVLMDMQMPVMDGLQATRALRLDPQNLNLPIVAMTANAMASDRAACLAAGMNDHVGKPFDFHTLVDLIARYCEARLQAIGPAPAALPEAGEAQDGSTAWVASSELDVQEAVSRLGGDRRLYAKVLQGYLRDAPLMVARAREALQATSGGANVHSGVQQAAQELHGLKGVSGTVGAKKYAQAVSAAELRLKAVVTQVLELPPGASPNTVLAQIYERCSSECQALERGFERVLQAATLVLAAQPQNPDTMGAANEDAPHSPDLARALQQLDRLLASADMASIDQHEAILRTHGAQHPLLGELNAAMEVLDFEAARRALGQVLNNLSGPETTG